ncbi:MAG: hypothetical protein K8R69_08140 [Deltaproteobacteria bacterium]|nr:hypothetical protein [Deltaproteobacteria bacterium]
MSLESLRLKSIFLGQYEAISRETDPQLRGEALLRLAGELEAADDLEAAAEIYDGLKADKPPQALVNRAEQRLEALKGRGSFGAQFELSSRRFIQQSSDPRMILPMLVGSTVFQIGRTAALGRLASVSKAGLFTRGIGARVLANLGGFAAPTFTLLQREMNPTDRAFSQDLRQSVLTLGALKFFAFGAQQSIQNFQGLSRFSHATIPQAFSLLGLLAVNRIEQVLGWRPISTSGALLADTLATWLSLGVGAHLGSRLLGRRFAQFQNELASRGSHHPPAELFSSFGEAPLFAGLPQISIRQTEIPSGILMMASVKDGKPLLGKGDLVVGYRGDSRFATVEARNEAAKNLREAMLDSDLPPDERLEHLETFGAILKTQEGEKEFGLGMKALRRLIQDPKIEWSHPVEDPVATVPFYAHHLLLRKRAAEFHADALKEYPLGHPEVEAGTRALREVLEKPGIPTRFRPTFATGGWRAWWNSYFHEAESQTLQQLLPIYARSMGRLGTESPEVFLGLRLLTSEEFQARLSRAENAAIRDQNSGSLAKAYAGLLSASSMYQREMGKKEIEKLHPNIVHLKGLAGRNDNEALRALGVLAEFDESARKDLLDLRLMGIPGLKERIAAVEAEAKAVKKLRDGQMAERIQPVQKYDVNGRYAAQYGLVYILKAAISKLTTKR